MGSPTLAERIGVAIAVALVVAVALTATLVAIGIVGLGMVGAGSIALLLLVGVTILIGLALAFALGAGIVGLGLTALVILVVLLLGGIPLVPAALAAVAFLILAGIVLALGAPLAITTGLLLLALVLLPLGALALGAISLGIGLVVFAVVGIGAIFFAALSVALGTHRLPLRLLGLGSLRHMPAIPFCGIPEFVDTVLKLKTRQKLEEIPKNALTNEFTLKVGTPSARTASARSFLFGTEEDRSFHLDDPSQFAMGWTTFTSIDQRASGLLGPWSQALTDADEASAQFWPNLARYTGAFGIPPLRKVAGDEAKLFKDKFGIHPGFDWDLLAGAEDLYVMDFTIFGSAEPPTVSAPRFTPSTLVFLARDAASKTFTPILIEVSNGDARHVYANHPDDPIARSTWLYALQAAKVSATVWGIWLGHVYRYHIVTAAMQMTMFQRLPPLHPVRQVIGLQSEYLIPFDLVLLIDWSFPPPTSLSTSIQFLKLTDKFSEQRTFFQDDPQATLDAQGLAASDFTTPLLSMSELLDLPKLAEKLKSQQDPGAFILSLLSTPLQDRLQAYGGGTDFQLQAALASELNAQVIEASALLDVQRFQGVALSSEANDLLEAERLAPGSLSAADRARLHRLLLQDAFPGEIMPMSWNLYPVARYLLRIHEMSKKYVSEVVEAIYADDLAVSADVPLQAWFLSSQDPVQGNVAGLLPVDSKAKLKDVLASLVYRVTAHGISRMAPIANPALSFVANFPPCLEDSRLPDPRDPNGMAPDPPTPLSTKDLLAFLPKTGTIGEMLSFLYAFSFTPPYKPLIPIEGTDLSGGPDIEKRPFIGPAAPRCNAALQVFRDDLEAFIRFFTCDSNERHMPAHMNFQPTPEQIHQWELNIET